MSLEFGLGLSRYVLLAAYMGVYLAIILTFVYRIEVGLIYFALLLPQQNLLARFEIFPLGTQVIHLFITVLAIKWVATNVKAGMPLFARTALNWPLLLFMAWTYFELWWGTVFSGAPVPLAPTDARFAEWKNLIIPFALFYVVVNTVRNKSQIKWIVFAMVVSMLAMDRSFYANFFRPDHYTADAKAAGAGAFTYLGANELAAFYAMYSPMLVSLFVLDRSNLRRVFYGIGIVGNLYSLLFLFSRGGYFAIVAGLLVLGIVRHRLLLLVLVGALLCWRAVIPTAVAERLDMTWSDDGPDRTTEERISMWKIGIGLIESSPALGVGYYIIPQLGIHDEVSGNLRRSLHNGYVSMLVELGFVGTTIWMLVFASAGWMAWKVLRTTTDGFFKGLAAGAIACLAATLVFNLSSEAWQYISVMGFFWLMLALVARSSLLISEESKTTEVAAGVAP